MLLRQPDFESGVKKMFRAERDEVLEARIPLRYDYEYGGWLIDYLVNSDPTDEMNVELNLRCLSSRFIGSESRDQLRPWWLTQTDTFTRFLTGPSRSQGR